MKTTHEFLVIGAFLTVTGFRKMPDGCVGFCPVFSTFEKAKKAFPNCPDDQIIEIETPEGS